ncbi:hypothetical protein KFL_002630180 [Klebsormidium nitens]|uniref:DNA polymerase delta subunit 3 n=1 Tax=Klebsormidium nitens TaxID=105231 RepID=A0A1Y1I4V1_KLENI|nr:hypothetical protein KFL_002630180 [Klebsormidium nitens]|eukprot:GAQ85975.1 hypothetical protein KFL_002630180 [Klebsormidium nitens]
MASNEHAQLLDNLDMLVADEKKIVSFKWLSRAFSLPSNTAKEVLKAYAEKKKDAVKVVYLVSGWTRNDSRAFSLQLVGPSSLEGALANLDEASSHVYSVQPSIPKDPAALWTPDFIQAEELFNRPPEEDNCLRNNSLSGVVLTNVKCNPGGRRRAAPPPSNAGEGALKPVVPKGTAEKPATPPASPVVKTEEVEAAAPKAAKLGAAPKAGPATGAKGTKSKAAPAKGGLANLWGKAPPKTKAAAAKVEEVGGVRGGDAEARIRVMEEAEGGQSSGEEEEELAPRGRAGRRRRVALDEEEEEDDGGSEGANGGDVAMEDAEAADQGADVVMRESEEPEAGAAEEAEAMDAVDLNETTPPEEHLEVKPPVAGVGGRGAAAKRRKIARSTFDERGREVVEMVWEDELGGEGAEAVADVAPEPIKAEPRPPSPPKPAPKKAAAKEADKPKAPAKKAAPAAKGGKKGAQGNIMSFFKKK